jgi:hypothetical protein
MNVGRMDRSGGKQTRTKLRLFEYNIIQPTPMNTSKQLVVVAILLLACTWPHTVSAFPWDTPQQNDQFLLLLVAKPPVGINIFSHYVSNTVPDARGSTYSVSITGSPQLTTGSDAGAVNVVTSLYIPVGTVLTWPTPPTQGGFTRCWTWVTHNGESKWVVECFSSMDYEMAPFSHVTDQTTGLSQVMTLPALDTAVGNYVHSSYTWDIELDNAEMKLVTRALRKELGGVPYEGSVAVVPITDIRAYKLRFLLALRPPQSINIFADFVGTTVRDRMGNGFEATLTAGEAVLVPSTGLSNGANNTITALQGTMSTALLWPVGSIPPIMTICSVSRYAGSCTPSAWQGCGQILTATGSPSYTSATFHGHASKKRGMARYSGGWTTQYDFSEGVLLTDWLVMCGTNEGAIPDNVVIDQFGVGTRLGGVKAETNQFNVNYHGFAGAVSDFEMHSLYIWPASLSAVQMRQVTTALRAQIGGTPDIGGNLVGPEVAPMAPAPTAYEQVCAAGFNLETATGDCVCGPGLTIADGACVACAAGTYSTETGRVTMCDSCPAGTSSDEGSDELIDCKCVAGYTAISDGVSCTACGAGTYKAAIGYGECTPCSAGTYSIETGRATVCNVPGVQSVTVTRPGPIQFGVGWVAHEGVDQ